MQARVNPPGTPRGTKVHRQHWQAARQRYRGEVRARWISPQSPEGERDMGWPLVRGIITQGIGADNGID